MLREKHFLFDFQMNLYSINPMRWLPWWLSGKEPTCQRRRDGFYSSVGKIPWRRKWQPIPVFLAGKSHGGHKGLDTTSRLNVNPCRTLWIYLKNTVILHLLNLETPCCSKIPYMLVISGFQNQLSRYPRAFRIPPGTRPVQPLSRQIQNTVFHNKRWITPPTLTRTFKFPFFQIPACKLHQVEYSIFFIFAYHTFLFYVIASVSTPPHYNQ